jgi:hypothetical protein
VDNSVKRDVRWLIEVQLDCVAIEGEVVGANHDEQEPRLTMEIALL